MSKGAAATTLTVLAIGMALLMVVPTGLAHTATEPLSVETQVLQDEGEDAFYWFDGYDLWDLLVREAHWQPTGEDGLIFRFTLYGGFSETSTADQLHIDLGAEGPAGPQTFRLSTPDDQTWETPLTLIEVNVTEDAPPFTGVTTRIQAFAPYSAFNATQGDALKGIHMASWADQDLLDEAPGPFYAPGSQGMGAVPAGESERLVDELPLDGPTGYFDTDVATNGTQLTITVESTLENNGQHIGIVPTEAAGWTAQIVGPQQASLDPGETATFTINVTASDQLEGPLPVAILSDLGGREQVHVGINGTTLQTALEPASVEVAPETTPDETPVTSILAFVSLMGAALLRRRRR